MRRNSCLGTSSRSRGDPVAGEQYADLTFPVGGIDQQGEVGQQPGLTTPVGVNVRGLDPRTRRLRGGSRSGLSKYLPVRVDGTSTVIQHLAMIVDPTTAAMLASFVDDYGVTGGGDIGEGIADPMTNVDSGGDPDHPDYRNPGRDIPDGGSGVTLNPRTPDIPDADKAGVDGQSSSGWEYVQHAEVSVGQSILTETRTDSKAFDSATERHQLIVVFVYCTTDYDGPDLFPPTITVTDSLGNVYNALTAEQFTAESAPYSQGADYARIYWARNEAGGACTVSVKFDNTNPNPGGLIGFSDIVIMEYRGLQTSTPADGEAAGAGGFCCNDGSILTGTMTPGPVAIGGQTRLVLGGFYAYTNGSAVYTPAAGWTRRVNSGWQILEELSSGASEEPTLDWDHTASPFAGVGYVTVAAGWRYR